MPRLVPCPVCRAEITYVRFDLARVDTDAGEVRAPDHDGVTLTPCGHTFERREYPDWMATFASEGEE